ncbi:hypothetical protein DCS_01344 [Drechmeria coniospora]|uniref:Uncharacterized protein n=1 Tax=Drechmeria coniospora TaxID=98403 RepID=A0A151GT05_DRECN|nr:hypothetical protein DCS_01344 [Drechmeria coniospora]KYK60208.1 hypothetical protein DCS_01344 [Drechmeria coniospora]
MNFDNITLPWLVGRRRRERPKPAPTRGQDEDGEAMAVTGWAASSANLHRCARGWPCQKAASHAFRGDKLPWTDAQTRRLPASKGHNQVDGRMGLPAPSWNGGRGGTSATSTAYSSDAEMEIRTLYSVQRDR